MVDIIFILQPVQITFVLSHCVANQQAPFFFSLKGRYHLCVLTRPYSAALLSRRRDFTHIWCPSFCNYSLIAWLWWPRKPVFLDSKVLYNWTQFLAEYHTQSSAHIAEWNTPLIFLRKWPICLSKKFALSGNFWSSTHLGAYRHTFRKTEAIGYNLCILPCSSVLISLRKKLYTLVWHLDFYSCYQGPCLHHVALVASGAYAHRSLKTVTNGERVLKQLPLSGHSKRQKTQKLTPSVKEAYKHSIIATASVTGC